VLTDGQQWLETTTNLGGRKEQTLQLDNSPQQRRNPIDQSPVAMASALRLDGCVVTESEYPSYGVKQTLIRRFVAAGSSCSSSGSSSGLATSVTTAAITVVDEYHVTNRMVLKDGTVLTANSFFTRIDDDLPNDDDDDEGAGGGSSGMGA
jgi:hypothetical protein